jgi:hypothetical protein
MLRQSPACDSESAGLFERPEPGRWIDDPSDVFWFRVGKKPYADLNCGTAVTEAIAEPVAGADAARTGEGASELDTQTIEAFHKQKFPVVPT